MHPSPNDYKKNETIRRPVMINGSFLFGNLLEFGKDPLAFIRRAVALKQPIVNFRMPVEQIALVTDADMAHQILVKHADKFKKADKDVGVMAHVLGNGLVTNNDFNFHKKQRKLTQPGFHFRRIQGYADTMIRYTEQYSEQWPVDSERDINDDMFKLTLFIVSKTLFDNDVETMSEVSSAIGHSMRELQELMNKGFQSMYLLPDWMPMPGSRRLKKAKQRLHQSIQTMIEARTAADGTFSSGDDLLSMLLEAEYEDGTRMSRDQLMDELVTLLSAGHETTSNTMTWVLYLLASHPEIQEQAYQEVRSVLSQKELSLESLDELPLIEQIIKEGMRMYPPAWVLNTRQAVEDVEVNGYFFEKGKHVFISPYANHHNPNYFPDPEKFRPERFNAENEALLPRYAYMPFGGGNRVCIGNSFAMMENRIILTKLLQSFRFELSEKTRIEPQPHVTLCNKDGMWLRVIRR
jgi:cytochrome P450